MKTASPPIINPLEYIQTTVDNIYSVQQANELLFERFGIVCFFENEREFYQFKNNEFIETIDNSEKIEYGDFQTNSELTDRIVNVLIDKCIDPQIIIEPTVGKGSFVISALKYFENVEKIIAIEIYKPYLWKCKLSIVEFYLKNKYKNKPEIRLIHDSVFSVNFEDIADEYSQKECLILGNPPWVTNSKLGELNSANLPAKNNFKKHNGLDALTGKSNFDIAEYICYSLIRTFQNNNGNIALLLKNTVIKNVVFDQQKNKFRLSSIEKYSIDSKKEFNASVNASLFVTRFNDQPSFQIIEHTIYKNNKSENKKFGWINDKFVSNVEKYALTKDIDGMCPFEWRQGIKHDCSQIMELEKIENYFVNKKKEKIQLEYDLVYPILKSSDLKNEVITQTRKYTIVTQKKVGQSTDFIKQSLPLTYDYLDRNIVFFNNRKSSIYRNKPHFSIFGVGNYSFQPYKIAISGLYKTEHFSLILTQNNKPILVDDTCYMLGFDNLNFAVYTHILLNSDKNKNFLQAITFRDSKRMFTKDVLKRIDLLKLSSHFDEITLRNKIDVLNQKYKLDVTWDFWNDFIVSLR